jgi:hypothetical protein
MITYVKYEIVRTFRNRRFFAFSIGFPLVLYFVIAGPNRNENNFLGSGIPAPLYYMIGLTAFGTMNTVLSTGTRIAGERAAGWNRQLRLTPLSTRAYFRTKVLVAYLLALITIAILYVSGISLGVHLTAGEWVRMTALILVGLVPFVALGVLMGTCSRPTRSGRRWAAPQPSWRCSAGCGSRSTAARCTTSPSRSRRTGWCRQATSRSAAGAGAPAAGSPSRRGRCSSPPSRPARTSATQNGCSTPKAVVHNRYGPPDVLELQEIDMPVVEDDHLLVRVQAASVNPFDWHLMRGVPCFARALRGCAHPRTLVWESTCKVVITV